MIEYLLDGIAHITDFDGYDHMLFLITLCAPFQIAQWKQIVLLATAFTVGHSLSLAASALGVMHFPSNLIETLIPITILVNGVIGFVHRKKSVASISWYQYVLTVSFGLIHGMGFSTYFRMIEDSRNSILGQLLAFNVGVEIGQIIIILTFLLLTFFVTSVLKISRIKFTTSLFALVIVISSYLLFEKLCS